MNPIIWLLGLSGSGKTTLSLSLKKKLDEQQIKNIILDGDLLRGGLNNNLGFSLEDRIAIMKFILIRHWRFVKTEIPKACMNWLSKIKYIILLGLILLLRFLVSRI